MGAGLFYQINLSPENPLFLGLSTNGLFDKYNANITDVGVSIVTLNKYVTLSTDALIDSNNGFQSVVGGINIATESYFDLKGSIGYNPNHSRFFSCISEEYEALRDCANTDIVFEDPRR